MIPPATIPSTPSAMFQPRPAGSTMPPMSCITPTMTHQNPTTHAIVRTDAPGRTITIRPASTVSSPSAASTTRISVGSPRSPATPRAVVITPQTIR